MLPRINTHLWVSGDIASVGYDMAWHIVEKLVQGAGEHSTLIGKIWTTSFFVIRLILVAAIAKGTWDDSTQEKFICNTESPGCKQVCFNSFNPIAPTRYWFFQLLGVSLTTIIFNVYTTHKLALVSKAIEKKKKWKKEREKSKETKKFAIKADETEDEKEEKKDENKEGKEDKKKDEVCAAKLTEDQPAKLYLAYFFMVLFRLILEVLFMVGQYYLYSFKFVVPELFECRHWPCPNVVDCFVTRPKEKTIMICAFYATGCIMIVLNVVELYSIAEKFPKAWKARHQDITKEVFGDTAGPQFDMPMEIRRWNPGAEGIYQVSPSGYPDAVGIPTLYTGYSNKRRGRRSGLAKTRYRHEY